MGAFIASIAKFRKIKKEITHLFYKFYNHEKIFLFRVMHDAKHGFEFDKLQ